MPSPLSQSATACAETPALRLKLGAAIESMFPSRRATEALLDLPERKMWGPRDREAAIVDLAAFLAAQLDWPAGAEPEPVAAPDLDLLRASVEKIASKQSPGTAAWLDAVAEPVGATSAKSLANSRPRSLRPNDRRHRWVAWLARSLHTQPEPTLWRFDLRNADATARRVARWTEGHVYDAADELLLISLVALWQRRRPVTDVRAQRGAPSPRRTTPKPSSRLFHEVDFCGQARALLTLLEQLHGTDSWHWQALVLEWLLTQGHLVMQTDRSGGRRQRATRVLSVARKHLDRGAEDPDVAASWRWRIEVMEAWRDRRDADRGLAPDTPYGIWSAWLSIRTSRENAPVPTAPLPWMLTPQIRSRRTPGGQQ